MSIHAKILGGVAAAALFAAAPAIAQTSTMPAKTAATVATVKTSDVATKTAVSDAAKTVKPADKTDMTAAKTEKTAATADTATKETLNTHHHRWHQAMTASTKEKMAANRMTAELNAQQLTHPGSVAGVTAAGHSMSNTAPHSKATAASDKKAH